MYRLISLCVAPLCVGVLWYCPPIWKLVYLFILTIFLVLGAVTFTFWGHVSLSSPHQTSLFLLERVEKEVRQIEETLKEDQSNWPHTTKKSHLPVIFGRTVDSQLQLLIDYVLRDFVARWLKELSHKPEPVIDKFKEHVWGAVQNLYERLLRVDAEKLLASDMVTKITQHFERIRIARSCALELNQPPVFALAPHLMAADTELHYLRQISELIIMFLMPRCYSLAPATHLMREILACKVLQPAIDLVTEPDYINQKIIQYLEAQKEVDAMHVRTHEYAKTFEDYIRLINSCNNVDTLKRLRYDIVTQIMQATTLQNVKRAKGVDIEVIEKSGSQNVSRQQIADAKKLKRYINQLTIAKAECETALRKLGWDGAFPTVESDSKVKTLPLHKIMESVTGRRYLAMFLETMCSQGLVGFWMAVEELRHSPRSSWHQLGAEIFYTYIRSPSAEIKVDKDTRKRMEAFLLGDKGPEVFYEVQDTVVDTIQEKYYHSFLLSDHYTALIAELATEEANKDITSDRSPIEDRQLSNESVSSAESVAGTIHLTEHSTYARRKLDELQERHNNKIQALAALRASLKPESPALAMLANEVEKLAGEQMRLEAHLARTDTWAEHLGRWRASVHSAEVIDESKPPQFVIVVHMAEQEAANDDDRPEQITTGWVLLRTLNEFQELHRKLRPMCAELKNLELPTNSFKFLFGKNDKNSLEKAKILIQKYLEFVLEDDRLNQSEALYTFLNPSSEYLKQGDLPKKNKFSFSTLFKSTSSEATTRSSQEKEQFTHLSADEDEISLYLDGNGADNSSKAMTTSLRGAGAIAEERDSIAEPLYALLSEVFDMRGVFRWLRKTLVTFVQITYGRTINRQIKETVTWLFSEQMLHYYISVVLKSWWPGGTLSENTSNRNFQDKEHTRTLALQQLSESVLDALSSLVGAQAAARGAHKLFYTLQNTTHNKQLFYELFELVLLEVFPELKRYQ
ncbi:sorting nexin-25 isoform X1 [Helicoverpa zea]|uniref:sorting nexin-25 isoform X1 n=1 Tax=Helicoverpa zea TaxID=7113 RepID=UPI001F590CEF|nr:sorting nexin-25 isoform X1 [Helicoverpa zea]XP_047022955.1 sorting nexin-25 isoform X1 [Helicoverpa zea]